MSAPYAETAAEIAAISNDVDQLRELIEESDRLLEVLECLNRDDDPLTDAASRWTADLNDKVLGFSLPRDSKVRRETQAALNHVYDVIQKVLFRRHLKAIGFDYVGLLDESDEELESMPTDISEAVP